MLGLKPSLIGSLVLLTMIDTSYSDQVCYPPDGEDFCFDVDLKCWNGEVPEGPESMGNKFYLYTRENSGNKKCIYPDTLDWNDLSSLTHFDDVREVQDQRKTVVLIHGFRSQSDDEYLIALCDAFMEWEDVNIIMVDWQNAAAGLNYWQSRQDSRLVAQELGKLLQLLHEERGLDYDKVHIVGHSLGAHLAGFTGQWLKEKTEQNIGRISGLDPASPEYEKYLKVSTDCNLDKTDAKFVDIIHSDGSAHLYGLEQPIGHQDFYPNDGVFMQPKCLFKVACSHMRAIDFYIASLKTSKDSSSTCFETERRDNKSCGEMGCPQMGIKAEKGPEKTDGSYILNIDSSNCNVGFIL